MSRYDALPWMKFAHDQATDGIAEEPHHDNRGPVIRHLIELAHCGQEGDPYCAIGVNAAHEQCGMRGTRSALARSFERDPNFVRLRGPAFGAVQVFWRGRRDSGLGHVNLYTGETENHVYGIGWNQHDDCNEAPFPRDGRSFGLVGYFWHVSVPLPQIAVIKLSGNGQPIGLEVT